MSSTTREKYDRMVSLVQEELKKHFKPEFLNRLDEIIVFQQLTQEDVRQIAEIMLNQLVKRVLEQFGIILTIERLVQDKLSVDGFNPTYGARPLRRVITSSLEDPLANLLLEKNFRAGTHLTVSLTEQNTFSMDVTGFTEPVPVFDSVNGKTNSERKPVVKSTRLYKLSSLSQYVKDERAKNAKLREEKEDKKREERDEKKL